MGVDYYIGEEQVRLTSAYWYNEFLNFVAKIGEYPQILEHSPIHGKYKLTNVKPSLYNGSVKMLKKEVDELLQLNPPEWAEHILLQMLTGCETALRTKQEITMDDGALEG